MRHERADRVDDQGVRAAATFGAAAGVAALFTVVAATTLAPWFSWTGDALSNLGVAPVTGPLFNGALVLGGLFALPYAWALGRAGRRRSLRTAVGLGLTSLAMVGIGLFPQGTPLHLPTAVTFYLLLTATLAVDWVARPGTTGGRAALAAATLHLLGWAAWSAGVRPGPGLALPELLGALLLVGWMVAGSPVAPLRYGAVRRSA